ncbi:unnamed protein product, partial [marine sediment metagenome]
VGGVPSYTWIISSGALPAGLSLSTTGEISGTPTATGTYNFTVEVQDANNLVVSKGFSITITEEANTAPTITPIQTDPNFKDSILVGEVFTYNVQAYDPDAGDVLAFSLQNFPTGMSI